MKYIRNSGKRKKMQKEKQTRKPESKTVLTTDQELAELQKRYVETRLKEDIQWLKELDETDHFSFEWVHKVAVEILLQCIGKKDVLMGLKGGERLVKVFKEKPALEALSMIAKMNGHLFDTVKGTIKQSGTIDHNHQGQIELKPDTNRTNEVFNILEACGALNPPKRLSREDVEVISA